MICSMKVKRLLESMQTLLYNLSIQTCAWNILIPFPFVYVQCTRRKVHMVKQQIEKVYVGLYLCSIKKKTIEMERYESESRSCNTFMYFLIYSKRIDSASALVLETNIVRSCFVIFFVKLYSYKIIRRNSRQVET